MFSNKIPPILSLDPRTASIASKTAAVETTKEADDTDAPLTMESTHALLQSLGWSTEKIDGGYVAIYQLSDREVQFLYNDETVEDCPQFDSAFLIDTRILATVCKMIDPTYMEDLPDLELNFEAKGLEI
ncbi:hypothetical protein [Bartonella rattaustraliani]|uniref:hypothetical protein n=1 Tax=Bartonella rattaustraliani TaxID=481139 RepID=UPI00047625F2